MSEETPSERDGMSASAQDNMVGDADTRDGYLQAR